MISKSEVDQAMQEVDRANTTPVELSADVLQFCDEIAKGHESEQIVFAQYRILWQ